MKRISELKFKVYHCFSIMSQQKTKQREMTLSKVRENIRLILKTYTMNLYNPIKVTVNSTGGDYIRIDVEGFAVGFGKVDHHIFSIERPSMLTQEMFSRIEGNLAREFGSSISKRAELKFDFTFQHSNFDYEEETGSLKDFKNHIRSRYFKGKHINIEVAYAGESVYYSSDGGVRGIYIGCPSSMKWELFLTILKGAGLLDEDKVNKLGRTISKRAELKFDFTFQHYRRDIEGETGTLKDFKNHIRSQYFKGQWIHIEVSYAGKSIYYSTGKKSNRGIYIGCPSSMEWELFLTILKGAGLLDEDNVNNLGRTISKRAELELEVATTDYNKMNNVKLNSSEKRIRVKMTFSALKVYLNAVKKLFAKNKELRDAFWAENEVKTMHTNEGHYLISFTQDYYGDNKGVVSWHEKKNHTHEARIFKPDTMPLKTFKLLMKGITNEYTR